MLEQVVEYIYATLGKIVKKEELGGRPTVHLAVNSETNNSEMDNQPVIFHVDTLVIYIYIQVKKNILYEEVGGI